MQSQIRGLTGDIEFDVKGKRTNFQLDIVELSGSGLNKVGTWNSTAGLSMARQTVIPPNEIDTSSLKNTTFVVLTALVSSRCLKIARTTRK